MDARVEEFLTKTFGDAILGVDRFRGQLSVRVSPDSLFDVCQAFYEDTDLDLRFLSDITSVDWYEHAEEANGRFEVVYNLYSIKHHYRLLLKVRLPGDNPEIKSLTSIWQSANWLEREVWDMMGITFVGHPDLTKILTPDDLDGHPLRRDFPLTWEQPRFSWNKDDPPEVVK
jgi:NADH-quinone oxidoreductase subunit C